MACGSRSVPLSTTGHHRRRRAWIVMHIDVSPAFLIALVAAIVNGALGVRILDDHGSACTAVSDQPPAQPGTGAHRGGAQRLRIVVNRAGAAARLAPDTPHRHRSAPGIVLGTLVVAQVNASWLRFGTFVVLPPLCCCRRRSSPADRIGRAGRARLRASAWARCTRSPRSQDRRSPRRSRIRGCRSTISAPPSESSGSRSRR